MKEEKDIIKVTDCKEEAETCCNDRHKHRDGKEYKDLINRLSRIEGQVRGIKKMVEEERYCVDILTQMSAVQSACNAFSRNLLENHIKTCVVEDIKQDREGTVKELCDTIRKVMK